MTATGLDQINVIRCLERSIALLHTGIIIVIAFPKRKEKKEKEKKRAMVPGNGRGKSGFKGLFVEIFFLRNDVRG